MLGMGYEGWMGFGTESSWGAEATRAKFLDLIKGGDGIDIQENPVYSESMNAPGYLSEADFRQGAIVSGGPVSFELPYEGSEVLLLHALGSVATTTLASGVYQHVFTMSDILQSGKGLSVEICRDAATFIYTGCKVNTLEMRSALNANVKVSIGLIAKDGAIEPTPTTETIPTVKPFTFTEGAFTWGVSAVSVIEAAVTLNNNLEPDRRFLGSRFISEPCRAGGKLSVTFSATVEFDSTSKYVDFRAATLRALQLKFTGEVISGGYFYSVQIDMANARILHALPLINDEGRIIYEITGRAFRTASVKEMSITAINAVVTVA